MGLARRFDDGADIIRPSAMVGALGQASTIAAAPMIHGPNGMAPRLRKDHRAIHVGGVVRASQTVKQQHHCVRGSGPCAARQHITINKPYANGFTKRFGRGRRQLVSQNCLKMRAASPPRGHARRRRCEQQLRQGIVIPSIAANPAQKSQSDPEHGWRRYRRDLQDLRAWCRTRA